MLCPTSRQISSATAAWQMQIFISSLRLSASGNQHVVTNGVSAIVYCGNRGSG